jgi:hypothetical protein
MKFIAAFLAGFGVLGVLGMITFWCAMLVGWGMNLYKLVQHLPTMDVELIVRLMGIFPPIGGIVGWF